jgi:anti-anti-sigma regulatory factor
MKTSEILNTLAPPSSTRSCQQTVIALEDIVDLESTPRLDALFQAACSGAERVTLDMSRLQLIDEAAIASVLRGMATLGAAGVDLHVRYPSPMALQLFEMCGPLQMLGVDFALGHAAHRPRRFPTAGRGEPVTTSKGLRDQHHPP